MNKITARLNNYLSAGNCEPNNVYLGRYEYSELTREAAPAMGVKPSFFENPTDDDRLEWRGIKVFKVDSDNHIAFS